MSPLKNFVHEILKRSQTSGSILQIALCYLEAIRSKISDISHDKKHGIRSHFMLESTISPATEAELEIYKIKSQQPNDEMYEIRLVESTILPTINNILTNLEPQQSFTSTDDIVKMASQLDRRVAVGSNGLDIASSLAVQPAISTIASASLPSPLLCPCKMFLASLILALKFSQDKCYSNCAWAKISGLPASEIGRCEHALGKALDWRLWVGKMSI